MIVTGLLNVIVALLGSATLLTSLIAPSAVVAAGCIVAGLGFIALALGQRNVAAVLAIAVAGTGLLAMGSGLLPAVGLASWFLTALGLFLSPWADRPPMRLCLALTGSTIAVLGAVGLIDEPTAVERATSIASGLALLLAYISAPRRPLALGLAGILLAAILWQAVATQEEALVQTNVAATLDAVTRQLRSDLDERVIGLVRMAARWGSEGVTSRDVFEREASLTYTHFSGYEAIGWIDKDRIIRWVLPTRGNEFAIGMKAGEDPSGRAALDAAEAARAPRSSPGLDFPDGKYGLLFLAPIADPKRNGFIFGSFEPKELFDEVLGNLAHGYGIKIDVQNEQVYARPGDDTPPEISTFLIAGVPWQVMIFPPHVLLRGSYLPEAMFWATALLSVLLALATHWALVARELAATLEERVETAVSERQSAETALRQSQKMEAIGQLTGGIAHDFNNMLTVISGNLDLLTGKLQDDPRLLRLVTSAASAAERGERLTAQLLAFSRRQQLDPRSVDLNEVIWDMEDLLDRTVGDRVTLTLSLSPDLQTALVDRNQVETALLNLVLNARAATPDTGRIEIRTANAKTRFVELSVADTGSGMSEEVRARAFEPFFTTKDRGKGTGLGLSQVYGFVRQSGGEVHIESTEKVGTVVRMLLPVAPASAEKHEEPVPTAARGSGETVLCVEDQEDVLEFATETLEGLGYKVVTATNADSALALLEAKIRVDLLFTDIMMPGSMDGTELARVVRSRWTTLPILLTSGYAERQVARESEFPFLRKPYRPATLASAIQAALHQHQQSAGLRSISP